jgi:hypothetical protein
MAVPGILKIKYNAKKDAICAKAPGVSKRAMTRENAIFPIPAAI